MLSVSYIWSKVSSFRFRCQTMHKEQWRRSSDFCILQHISCKVWCTLTCISMTLQIRPALKLTVFVLNCRIQFKLFYFWFWEGTGVKVTLPVLRLLPHSCHHFLYLGVVKVLEGLKWISSLLWLTCSHPTMLLLFEMFVCMFALRKNRERGHVSCLMTHTSRSAWDHLSVPPSLFPLYVNTQVFF